MMQFQGKDSDPNIALQVIDYPVIALLDTGSSETSIYEIAIIRLGIQQYVITGNRIMMRSASGHMLKLLGLMKFE